MSKYYLLLLLGIGRYICLELAKHGATIVCWSRSSGPNEEVAKEIRRLGGVSHPYTVDVSDKNAVHHAASLVWQNDYYY